MQRAVAHVVVVVWELHDVVGDSYGDIQIDWWYSAAKRKQEEIRSFR